MLSQKRPKDSMFTKILYFSFINKNEQKLTIIFLPHSAAITKASLPERGTQYLVDNPQYSHTHSLLGQKLAHVNPNLCQEVEKPLLITWCTWWCPKNKHLVLKYTLHQLIFKANKIKSQCNCALLHWPSFSFFPICNEELICLLHLHMLQQVPCLHMSSNPMQYSALFPPPSKLHHRTSISHIACKQDFKHTLSNTQYIVLFLKLVSVSTLGNALAYKCKFDCSKRWEF